MNISMQDAEARLGEKLAGLGIADAAEIAWATVWLEACGYFGVALLGEALGDPQRDTRPQPRCPRA